MIRFINIGFQIHEDVGYFSFYDTVTDKYLNFDGMYIFESEREFRVYATEDEICERCCGLIPEIYKIDE